jgi:ribosome-associated protein
MSHQEPKNDAGDTFGVEPPSRSARKRASEELQALGEALVDVRAELLAALPLPEALRDAVVEARKMPSFGAQRRQGQLIGKLMRRLDDDTVEAVRETVRIARGDSARHTALLHRAEQWRSELIADDERLRQWMTEHPDTDAQRMRALIRQARKEASIDKPGAETRHGRAYREIFRIVQAVLTQRG